MTTVFVGKSATVSWAASNRQMSYIKIDYEGEIVDTMNFTSGGFRENAAGPAGARITVRGPYPGALGLGPGDAVTVTHAVGGGTPSFAVPARVATFSLETDVKGVTQVAYNLESNGAFTLSGH